MGDKNDEVFSERETVSVPEIVRGTSLDYDEVGDVLYGGSYMMDDKAEVEEFLGLSMTEVQLFVGESE